MPQLLTHQQFRACRGLDFCYLCGRSLADAEFNYDHVPPRGIFGPYDRSPPLKLPTHNECNEDWSQEDELVAQFLTPLWGHYADEHHLKLRVSLYKSGRQGVPPAMTCNMRIDRVILRWVRGFHAALYREFLPGDCKISIHLPMPEGMSSAGPEPVDPAHLKYVATIKRNREAGRADRVVCCNAKCTYECVWDALDDGRPACIFALDIYDWCRLGAPCYARRSCVGLYLSGSGVPRMASRNSQIIFPFSNRNALDAFAD